MSGYISYELLRRNAQDEVVRSAGLMMETALAIRGYTIKQVRPLLEAAPAEGFLPQATPPSNGRTSSSSNSGRAPRPPS